MERKGADAFLRGSVFTGTDHIFHPVSALPLRYESHISDSVNAVGLEIGSALAGNRFHHPPVFCPFDPDIPSFKRLRHRNPNFRPGSRYRIPGRALPPDSRYLLAAVQIVPAIGVMQQPIGRQIPAIGEGLLRRSARLCRSRLFARG